MIATATLSAKDCPQALVKTRIREDGGAAAFVMFVGAKLASAEP